MKIKIMRRALLTLFMVATWFLLQANQGEAMGWKQNEGNRVEKINSSDGITRQEAVMIAKRYIKEKNLTAVQRDCSTANPKAEESTLFNRCWSVSFPPKLSAVLRAPFDFRVYIDRETGEVKSAGWNK